MEKVFYTKEQKDLIKNAINTDNAKRNPLAQSTGLMILDVLGEQQNTLQNIESILQRIENLILAGRQIQ